MIRSADTYEKGICLEGEKNLKMLFFGLVLVFSKATLANDFKLPTPEMQRKIVISLRDEMIRLDGEGLISRRDRPQSFLETTDDLARSALSNIDVNDFFNLFQKVDGTYTNLHSRAVFPSVVFHGIDLPWYKGQSVWLFAEVKNGKVKYYANHIDDELLKDVIEEGDELTHINGVSISSWLDENLLFCKFALREQCYLQFESNLLSLKLSWKGKKQLKYTFRTKSSDSIEVDIRFKDHTGNNNPLRKRCDYKWQERYPGFKLVHLGFFACLYESKTNPELALLRIASFQYNRRRNEQNPYSHIKEEVEALEKVWIPKSRYYKKLIVDVLDNHGGNLPISYYKILFKDKFQEQYVRFKKTPEFENDELRGAFLWNDPSQELLYQKYLSNGTWDNLNYGDFTPANPMFCADYSRPCDESLFTPKEHSFNGEVFVMLNEQCVSSCDGFVWALKNKLGAKLYGFPQAADSAFSRLRIDVLWDDSSEDGFKLQVVPEWAEHPEDLIVGQVVAVSQASDENGNAFNGRPLALDKKVPYLFGKFYPKEVLNAILTEMEGRSE